MNTTKFRAIRTEEDYEAALARVDEIFDAESGTPEEEELEELVDLIQLYESKHYPIDPPDPISAIKFRMEQAGLKQRDLVPIIGSRARVSEVLSGKRDITMSMARALHEHLGIPADVLLQKPGAEFDPALKGIDLQRFPWKEIVKREWVPKPPNLRDYASEMLEALVRPAGGLTCRPECSLSRKRTPPDQRQRRRLRRPSMVLARPGPRQRQHPKEHLHPRDRKPFVHARGRPPQRLR